MGKKKIAALIFVVVAVAASYNIYQSQNTNALSDLALANVEALANDEESGSSCPNGCSSIGWGTSKILECDCNYDHFSSCDRWGC